MSAPPSASRARAQAQMGGSFPTDRAPRRGGGSLNSGGILDTAWEYWRKKGVGEGIYTAAYEASEATKTLLAPALRWLSPEEAKNAKVIEVSGPGGQASSEDEALAGRFVDRYRTLSKSTSTWTGYIAASGFSPSPALAQHTTEARLSLATYADPVAKLSDGQSLKPGASPPSGDSIGYAPPTWGAIAIIVVIAVTIVAVARYYSIVTLAGAERDSRLVALSEKDLSFRQERLSAAMQTLNDPSTSAEAKSAAQAVVSLFAAPLAAPLALPALPSGTTPGLSNLPGLPDLPGAGGPSRSDDSWKFWAGVGAIGGLSLFLVGRFGSRN